MWRMECMRCPPKSFWRICYAVKLPYIQGTSQKLLSNSPKKLRITITTTLGCVRCLRSKRQTTKTNGVYLCSLSVTKSTTMPFNRNLKKFIAFFSAIRWSFGLSGGPKSIRSWTYSAKTKRLNNGSIHYHIVRDKNRFNRFWIRCTPFWKRHTE